MPRDKSKDYKQGNYKGYKDPEDYEFKFRKKYQPAWVGLKEMWAHYNYPCWDLTLLEKNIVPVPYAPKDKVNCNHKFSLTYKKWKKIVEVLCKYYVEYLLSGNPLKLPARMGSLQLKKWAYSDNYKSLDMVASAEQGKPVFSSMPQTMHRKPIIKWNRGKDCTLPKKYFWKINFVSSDRSPWKRIYKELEKDFSFIDKLIDA